MKKIKLLILLVIIIVFKGLFYLNSLNKSKKFESIRLGNVIDLWYTGSYFGEKKILEELNDIDGIRNKNSLSRFLIENTKIKNKSLEQKTLEILNKSAMKEGAITYYYDNIILCVNDFHKKIKFMMKKYDDFNKNILSNQKFKDENHCIIHYRLGDYITLGDTLNFEDIIRELKLLDMKFSAIEIMDGGKDHTTYNFFKGLYNNEKSISEKIYNNFYTSLTKNFPDIDIIKSKKRTTDEDFYRMSVAPILVTAGGSYAAIAAIAGTSRIIRTPSCKTLDFPSRGCRENLIVPKKGTDWKTYQYTML